MQDRKHKQTIEVAVVLIFCGAVIFLLAIGLQQRAHQSQSPDSTATGNQPGPATRVTFKVLWPPGGPILPVPASQTAFINQVVAELEKSRHSKDAHLMAYVPGYPFGAFVINNKTYYYWQGKYLYHMENPQRYVLVESPRLQKLFAAMEATKSYQEQDFLTVEEWTALLEHF